MKKLTHSYFLKHMRECSTGTLWERKKYLPNNDILKNVWSIISSTMHTRNLSSCLKNFHQNIEQNSWKMTLWFYCNIFSQAESENRLFKSTNLNRSFLGKRVDRYFFFVVCRRLPEFGQRKTNTIYIEKGEPNWSSD